MNAAAAPFATIRRDVNTPPLNRANVVVGLLLSLLAHGLFVAWSLHQKIGNATVARAAKPIEVRLLRPEPPPVDESTKIPPPPAKPENKKQQVAQTSRETITRRTPPLGIEEAHKEQSVTAPAPVPAPEEQKHLDMNAIHASIKSAVADVDREYADTPTGQLVAKPLYPPPAESKMGKMIDGTTRPDCKEQVAGMGLLAPLGALATLLDKKDNGCKWR